MILHYNQLKVEAVGREQKNLKRHRLILGQLGIEIVTNDSGNSRYIKKIRTGEKRILKILAVH